MMEDSARRFAGVAHLFGEDALTRFARASVCIVGLGGVGSWAAESLARTGIGHLRLVDPDEVCASNINRQLPALQSTIGKSKTVVLQERIREISPSCKIEAIEEFLLPSNADSLLAGNWDVIIDAVDRMSIKALILATSRNLGIPAVTTGGTGGKRNPLRIQVADLGASGGDELLRLTRRKLRRSFGWEPGEGNHYGVRAVFSTEPPLLPHGTCEAPSSGSRNTCESGMGSVVHVTAAFGFTLAYQTTELLLARPAQVSTQ